MGKVRPALVMVSTHFSPTVLIQGISFLFVVVLLGFCLLVFVFVF